MENLDVEKQYFMLEVLRSVSHLKDTHFVFNVNSSVNLAVFNKELIGQDIGTASIGIRFLKLRTRV